MNIPPLLMNVRVKDATQRFGIWIPLPLILIWLLMAAVLLIFLPLILIIVLVLWPSGWGKLVFAAVSAPFVLMNALRGLRVDVRGPQQIVKVTVV